ncbi:hypothetical protein NDU88_003391 [Pleurodeles waltl]|uniref:Uncharacterized protein n=1 Tax=Pleurodeles waltl TaxID=8319 RepID=A0AAV7RDS5_PLEWA|nr:hypothetical protein NDU88_003391 [Pleurodeles waltl]
MEPELHVLPMLVYLLFYEEYEWWRQRPHLRRLTTGNGSHVSGGACVRGRPGPVAVLAAVSVVAVLAAVSVVAVLAAVSVSEVLAAVSVAAVGSACDGACDGACGGAGGGAWAAPAEGHSRTFPAASDGCLLRKMLVTVTEAVDMPGMVQVMVAVVVAGHLAVFAAVHVGVVVDRKCDTGPSVGATMPSPYLLFSFWPFPSFDGAAVVLPLSPLVFAEPLVAGTFGFSLWDVGTFFTLTGGRMSLPSLRGTLAALMGGALHDPPVAGTTVPGDLVAEVLSWDLESLALGEGRGAGVGKRSMLARKNFLDTLGQEDGGGLGVEVEVVVVGGVRLLNLGEGAWAGGCCEVDGCWVDVCLRLCTLGGGLTDTLGEDTGDVCMVVGVVSARERYVVMGVLVREAVAEDVVHAGLSGDETGREEEDME